MPESMPRPGEVNNSDPFAAVEKPEPRKSVIGAPVNTEEEDAIVQAMVSASYPNKGTGARKVLMAFAQSARVRDAVASAVKQYEIE